MNVLLPIVREAFGEGAAASRGLDFDPAAGPRPLLPRPVAADAEALSDLLESLAWFWNTNAEWAEEQVAVGPSYRALVAALVETFGVRRGQSVVLPLSEPDDRLAAWREALPTGVGVRPWRPRRRGRLAVGDLEAVVDSDTRIVVQTKACAVTGALNETIPVAQRFAGTPVRVVAEASHFLSHGSLDIRNLRCDALIAAADGFFGAQGAAAWRRRPSAQEPPGPRSAGATAVAAWGRSLAYVERLGTSEAAPVAPPSERFGRREAMRRGMQAIRQQERILSREMLRTLGRFPRIRVLGESDAVRAAARIPTFTFVVEGRDATGVARALRESGVEVDAGSLGSAATLEALGVEPRVGAVRVGVSHYHTAEDIRRFGDSLEAVLAVRRLSGSGSGLSRRGLPPRGRRIGESGGVCS